MKPELITALAGILINLLTAAFVYGRLTERVRGHGKKLTRLEDAKDDQQKVLTRHEGEIGELFGHAGIHRG